MPPEPSAGDFPGAVHIAQGAQGIGAAAGDLIIGHAGRLAHPVHLFIDVGIVVGVHEAHVGAHELLQELIAQAFGDAPLLEDQNTAHAQPARSRGGEHGMVGLGSAGGEDQLCALLLCVGQQELQLPGLVAAQAKAGEVVAFDIDVGAQHRADVVQPVDRRGEQAQREPGEGIERFHGRLLSIYAIGMRKYGTYLYYIIAKSEKQRRPR